MYRWRRLGMFVGVLVMAATAPGTAEACDRWWATFDPCGTNAFPHPQCDQLNFADRKLIQNLLYSKTAKEACDNWAIYGGGYPNGETAEETDTQVKCFPPGSPGQFTILYKYDKTEECCSRTPNGPHKNIYNLDPTSNADVANDRAYGREPPFNEKKPVQAFGPTPGKEFTWWHKPVRYGASSDLHHSQRANVRRSRPVPGSPPDYLNADYPAKSYSALRNHATLAGLENCPDGELDNNLPGTAPCKPQLDHIVPKKDIYGCDCGTSSYANSLLISRELNQSMLNDCEDPARVAIMDVYAPLASSAAESPEAFPLDESDDVTGSAGQAGCTAEGSGATPRWGFLGFCAIAIGGMAGIRRRWAASQRSKHLAFR